MPHVLYFQLAKKGKPNLLDTTCTGNVCIGSFLPGVSDISLPSFDSRQHFNFVSRKCSAASLFIVLSSVIDGVAVTNHVQQIGNANGHRVFWNGFLGCL